MLRLLNLHTAVLSGERCEDAVLFPDPGSGVKESGAQDDLLLKNEYTCPLLLKNEYTLLVMQNRLTG